MLTQAELERRRRFMTASDSYTILGLNPWARPVDVFYSKVKGINLPAGEAAEYGNILEPIVLKLAAEHLKYQLSPGDWRVADDGLLAATLDASLADGTPVEAKTSGIIGPGSPREWGEEFTDEIPDRYIVQCQHQMYVTHTGRAYVPAIIGGRGFVMFQVERSDSLIQRIVEACHRFYEAHVLTGEAPKGTPSLDVVKSIIRNPGKTVSISSTIANALIEAQEARKAAEAVEEEAKAAVLAAMGDAETGQFPGGKVTCRIQHRKSYTVQESSFPVVRVTKPRKEPVAA